MSRYREPNYIERVAEQIMLEAPPSLGHDLALVYAVLVLAKGADTTREDVHDAWAAWMCQYERIGSGRYRALVPFDELPEDVQALDDPYVEAIHRTVARMAASS